MTTIEAEFSNTVKSLTSKIILFGSLLPESLCTKYLKDFLLYTSQTTVWVQSYQAGW